jgi:hypothetical protein
MLYNPKFSVFTRGRSRSFYGATKDVLTIKQSGPCKHIDSPLGPSFENLSRQVALHCATLRGLPTSCSPPIKIAMHDVIVARVVTDRQNSAISRCRNQKINTNSEIKRNPSHSIQTHSQKNQTLRKSYRMEIKRALKLDAARVSAGYRVSSALRV